MPKRSISAASKASVSKKTGARGARPSLVKGSTAGFIGPASVRKAVEIGYGSYEYTVTRENPWHILSLRVGNLCNQSNPAQHSVQIIASNSERTDFKSIANGLYPSPRIAGIFEVLRLNTSKACTCYSPTKDVAEPLADTEAFLTRQYDATAFAAK